MICLDIEDQQPSLVTGYNEMGQAIISSADAWERIITSQETALRLSKEEAELQLLRTSGSQYISAKANLEKVSGTTIEDVDEYRKQQELEIVDIETGKYSEEIELYKILEEYCSTRKRGGKLPVDLANALADFRTTTNTDPFIEIL